MKRLSIMLILLFLFGVEIYSQTLLWYLDPAYSGASRYRTVSTTEPLPVVQLSIAPDKETEEALGYERLDTVLTLTTTPKRLDSLLATSWGVTDIYQMHLQNLTAGAIVSLGSDYSVITQGMKLWYGDSYFDNTFYKDVTTLKLGASATANVAIKLIYKSR